MFINKKVIFLAGATLSALFLPTTYVANADTLGTESTQQVQVENSQAQDTTTQDTQVQDDYQTDQNEVDDSTDDNFSLADSDDTSNLELLNLPGDELNEKIDQLLKIYQQAVKDVSQDVSYETIVDNGRDVSQSIENVVDLKGIDDSNVINQEQTDYETNSVNRQEDAVLNDQPANTDSVNDDPANSANTQEVKRQRTVKRNNEQIKNADFNSRQDLGTVSQNILPKSDIDVIHAKFEADHKHIFTKVQKEKFHKHSVKRAKTVQIPPIDYLISIIKNKLNFD